MTLPKPYRVSVVVQTHWDREWYYPQQTFASRLLAVMERVCDQLDDGRLAHFLFDGQVCALEDLLVEAEPELAARVLAHARAGRIALGPWYVMADEFLVSGESLWRNLEIGLAAAERYGQAQRIGYLPDSFGHIAQMPQLLRLQGIPSAVTWRGIGLRHAEFVWQAPDGSRIDALYLTQGYYQHPLNLPDWEAALTRYLEGVAPRSLSSTLLLTQGGDHLAPHGALARRIAEFNAGQQRYELVQHSLQQHLESLGPVARPTLTGELRDNAQSFVLPDVLSTRRYLKDLHQRLEDRLLGETEPLWAWLRTAPPQHALERSWKLLIQQQAHDSICGCSVDEVHDEMQARLVALDQRLAALRGRALHAASLQSPLQHEGTGAPVFADDSCFTLFNPLPQPASGWQAIELLLQGPQPAAVRVLDGDGTPLPLHWLGCEPARSLRSPLDDFPEPVIGHRLQLRVALPLAGLQAVALTAEACEPTASGAATLMAPSTGPTDGLTLDEQGRLLWQDRLQLMLHTELDAGDSYNFSPAAQPARQWHRQFALRSQRRSGPFTELRLGFACTQPQSLDDSRQGPSTQTVTAEGELTLLLTEGSPWVEAQLTHRSAARDHRTRLVLAAGETLPDAAGDTAFHWTRRPVVKAAHPAQPVPQREVAVAVNPSLSAVQAGRIAVVHRGLQEFEIVDAPDGGDALALTLQRAVGWLSRRDLVSRGAGAGPDLATPGAQRGFDGSTPLAFALGDIAPDALLQRALRLRRPLLVLPGHRPAAWREPLDLPNPRLVPSALRRVGAELELRCWNPLDQALPGVLPGWTRIGSDATEVAPHQIATYRRPA
jgi:mannosylglycerate hydrolase